MKVGKSRIFTNLLKIRSTPDWRTLFLSGVHEKFLDVDQRLGRSSLLLHGENLLGVVASVDDVLVTTGDGEERPDVCEQDERHAIVEDVE